MLLSISILVIALTTTAVSQSNEFTSPPPGGSGQPTVTYVVGSTYPVTWSTTFTNLDLFLQSHGSQSNGNPLQSFNFSSGVCLYDPSSFLASFTDAYVLSQWILHHISLFLWRGQQHRSLSEPLPLRVILLYERPILRQR